MVWACHKQRHARTVWQRRPEVLCQYIVNASILGIRWRTQSGSKENSMTTNQTIKRITNATVKTAGLAMILWAVFIMTDNRLNQLRSQTDTVPGITAAEYSKQLDCLTRNIYWEAANEPFEGKVAVAQVTMNRVESGRFANTVCGVVYQKTVFYEKIVCQFSWYCEGGNKSVKVVHNRQWHESEEVAKKVLLEEFRLPVLEQAMYYHADHINPHWGKPKLTKIGHHIFYSES